MHKKKTKFLYTIISTFSILVIIFSLSACTSQNNKQEDTQKETTSITKNENTINTDETDNTENTVSTNNTENNETNTNEKESNTEDSQNTTINKTENKQNETNKTNNSSNNTTNKNETTTRPTIKDNPTQNESSSNNGQGSASIIIQQKDNTKFVSYESFLSAVKKKEYNMICTTNFDDCKSACCNIEFSGNIIDGSVKLSSRHFHSWNINNRSFMINYNGGIGASQSGPIPSDKTVVGSCDGCEFIVSNETNGYIFIKEKNKDHGHGWIWNNTLPTSVEQSNGTIDGQITHSETVSPTPTKTELDCGCCYYGSFAFGSIDLSHLFSDETHTHGWHYSDWTKQSIPEECSKCGFGKWLDNAGVKHIVFRCSKGTTHHITE